MKEAKIPDEALKIIQDGWITETYYPIKTWNGLYEVTHSVWDGRNITRETIKEGLAYEEAINLIKEAGT